MTLLLQIILPLIFALYLFTLYRNTTIGKAAFLFSSHYWDFWIREHFSAC